MRERRWYSNILIRETAGGDGFTAWHTLAMFYSRRTLARALRLHRAVLNPRQIKSLKELVGGLAKWDAALKELELRLSRGNTTGHEILGVVSLADFVAMYSAEGVTQCVDVESEV